MKVYFPTSFQKTKQKQNRSTKKEVSIKKCVKEEPSLPRKLVYIEKGIPEARRGQYAGLSYFFPEELRSKLAQAFTPSNSNQS